MTQESTLRQEFADFRLRTKVDCRVSRFGPTARRAVAIFRTLVTWNSAYSRKKLNAAYSRWKYSKTQEPTLHRDVTRLSF